MLVLSDHAAGRSPLLEPLTQPLRDEHLALRPELSALRLAADAVGTEALGEHLDRALRLLVRHMYPHMAAEEEVLYPAIDRIVGSSATATMRHDHDEIRRQSARLEAAAGEADAGQDAELRSTLYGLDAIIRLHLAKEEELYYPLLDQHLAGPEAAEIIAAMHRVERERYQAGPG